MSLPKQSDHVGFKPDPASVKSEAGGIKVVLSWLGDLRLVGWLKRRSGQLLELGTQGYDPDTRRRLMILNAIAYLIVITTAIYVVQHTSIDYEKFAPMIWLNAGLLVVALAIPLMHRINDIAGALLFVALEWVAIFLFTMYLGRPAGIHLQYFVGAAVPFVVLGLGRMGLVMAIVASGLLLHLYVWFNFPPGNAVIDAGHDVVDPLYTQAAITTVVLIAASVWYAFSLAEPAKAETEALLRNILPGQIVERLKALPDDVIADAHDNVTVMFADVSGFVALSRELGPERVVELLNKIVRRFDQLAARHGVEKIKTIGDAYMAVAGVPEHHADHAARMVAMAGDMLDVIADIRREQGIELHVRIGLASGPVTAGVIGTRKFSYDVWGDTVNLASRMEGSGERGRIVVSPETRRELGDGYQFEARQPVEIKGVGLMETWFVAPASDAAADS